MTMTPEQTTTWNTWKTYHPSLPPRDTSRPAHRGEATGPQPLVRHQGSHVADRDSWWPLVVTVLLAALAALLLIGIMWAAVTVESPRRSIPEPAPLPTVVQDDLEPQTEP